MWISLLGNEIMKKRFPRLSTLGVVMRNSKRLFLGALAFVLAAVAVQPAAAQTSFSQTNNFYDRFGNPSGVRVAIALPAVSRFWVFNLSEQFLRRAPAVQIDLLDQRFGLGPDRPAVLAVLQSIQQNRQLQDQQRQLDSMRQLQSSMNTSFKAPLYQPPIQIPRPPVYQPPMQIPQVPIFQPAGPPIFRAPLQFPRPPIYQPPITIRR
jgi:hypothetical protein